MCTYSLTRDSRTTLMYDVKNTQYLRYNLSLVFCHLVQYLCIWNELIERSM
jgi:hypothetical protein